MNELEQIKRTEDEVGKSLEKVRSSAAREVAEAKTQGDRIIEEEEKRARADVALAVEKAEADAKKEAEKLVESGKADVERLTKAAEKKRAAAVEFVMKKLRGD